MSIEYFPLAKAAFAPFAFIVIAAEPRSRSTMYISADIPMPIAHPFALKAVVE